jgi:hypothetical protein
MLGATQPITSTINIHSYVMNVYSTDTEAKHLSISREILYKLQYGWHRTSNHPSMKEPMCHLCMFCTFPCVSCPLCNSNNSVSFIQPVMPMKSYSKNTTADTTMQLKWKRKLHQKMKLKQSRDTTIFNFEKLNIQMTQWTSATALWQYSSW